MARFQNINLHCFYISQLFLYVYFNGIRWLIQISLGKDPMTGKYKSTTRKGVKTKKEAESAARAILTLHSRETFITIFCTFFNKKACLESTSKQAVNVDIAVILTLRELRSSTSTFKTVFLTFFHTWVTR
ncbi:Arm DNA-binding domain-containing protein [Siminovitchia fortis]|uniref:Arm DNA-binding domain-containing protein n=1 Tax=Siminovitchia fortis TaxID=254758 RepID=UPI0011A3E3D8|nr:Arm DNA-binding domain-containing protein [Siminovitchia fortis]